ncbi:MAG: 5-nucleotidase [Nocardioidaceae bacterium]|nr:5-nucleotidase [Nocardioidaceae bacterium]
MPAPRSHRRARLAVLVSVVMAITGFQFFLAPQAANAVGSSGLVIKEVYGAGGNSGAVRNADFVELYNPQASGQSTAGLSVQYRSAGGVIGGTQALPTVSIPPGGHYLIQMSATGANGAALPTPDLVAAPAIAMAAGGGQVILGTAASYGTGDLAGAANVVDMVGQNTATSFETTAAANIASTTQSLNRSATGTDSNSNLADFSLATPTPTAAAPGPLAATNPGNKNGVVGTPISGFNMAATGGTSPYTWTDPTNSLPPGIIVSAGGAVSGTPTTANPYSVSLTVTDSAGSPATAIATFTFTITNALVVTAIKDIQGTGTSSPMTGQNVNAQGVVTASYPTGGFNGFYLQTPGADTANASDAIFVYGGAGGFASYPAIGASVDVAGTVTENFGLTELTSATWSPHGSSLGTVTPKAVVPGTDCPLPGNTCDLTPALDTAREAAEGEAFQPTGPWTLTDVYDGGPYYTAGTNGSSMFGEMGVAAESTKALIAPTEVFDTQTQAAALADRTKWNNAHRIVIDDGSSTNYTLAANTGLPFPWYTPSFVPRVGAAVTFPAPAILISDFSQWRLLPSTQVVGAPTATQPQFAQTRAANATPQPVGGDLKLATFNVLNFFPTDGNEYVAQGGGNACTYFTDRAGAQITTNSCGNPSTSSGNGPRGAANPANVTRQRDKIVSAINTANADIVSLEELENSAKFGKSRDFAITQLVNALNAASTPGKWAFVPSPTGADLPALSDEDVIRTGFIYQPANVARVGASKILVGSAAFANAREPLAQAFKRAGNANSSAFAVIVNHFKSKGSGVDDGTGQGNANPDRIAQANALVSFASQFLTDRGLTKMFLVGDFNAYSEEDPVQVLEANGYIEKNSTTDPDEETYNFDGQIGSLDHVFANAAANADVTGADVWPINGYESVYYEYSRFNYNATQLYDSSPFRSSDHSPEIVGITAPTVEPATRDIQVLGTNDFHGRLANDPTAATAGAAVLAGAVKQLRAENSDTVFAAAGDLIGASTFESFIQHDKPTIDSLNEAGLDVSSAGNHEFDQGSNDLVNRVMAPYDAGTNPFGGANWQYIAANVRKNSDNSPLIPETWTKTFGSVKVGFVGAVTEHLPELVSPAGISTVHVDPIVASVNAAANTLKAGGADVIVLLVHEGAAATACGGDMLNPTSDFGKIVTGVNVNIDAIISGHTHLAYDCEFDVPGWAGRPVTKRPVVSAGQYGMALNKIVFSVDTATGQVQADPHSLLPLKVAPAGPFNYPVDPNTKAIVDAAIAAAGPLGAQPLGSIGGPFFRGKLADGTTENRGTESTLGNLVAEVQKWATSGAESGAAQIAFMNPGGLRQDMVGTGSGAFPRTLTFKQAADVQPFANTLVNEKLTGAQIKTVLEQQWQASGAARPFLKLGISKGFTYTSTPPPPGSAPGTRGTVTGMWLNGVAINPATTYSVTVNSFLASGGDGFLELNNGLNKQDTGKTDLQGMVDYMAAFGSGANHVDPDYKQEGVNVAFPVAAPAGYAPGDHVVFTISGWSMTNALDLKDTAVTVNTGGAGGTTIGTATLNNAAQATLPGFDVTGTATVDVVVPAATLPGPLTLTLVGPTTGTESQVTVNAIQAGTTQVTAADFSVEYGQPAPIPVTVTGPGLIPTGTVDLKDATTNATVATGTLDAAGKVTLTVPALTYPVGQVTLKSVYNGDAQHTTSEKTLTLTTTKAASTTAAGDTAMTYGQTAGVTVNVGAAAGVDVSGTVTVMDGATTLASAPVVGGVANVTLPAKSLEPGTATLTASYSGNANVNTSEDTFTVTTAKAPSTVVAPDVAVAPGGNGSVTVTVTAAGVVPTGTVTVKNGATPLGAAPLLGGEAQLNLPAVPNGTVLTAEYAGDDHVLPGSDSFTVTCCGKSSPVLAISDLSMEYGQARTATLTVSGSPGGSATGTATLKNGGVVMGTVQVSGGVALFTIPAGSLPVGGTVLTAEYSGDANLLPGAKAFTVTVTKASSTVTAKVKPKHPKVGHKVKLKVTVVGANGVQAAGQVTVKLSGKTFTGTLKNGHVTMDVGSLGKAIVKAIVVYSGSSTVAASQTTVKIKAS